MDWTNLQSSCFVQFRNFENLLNVTFNATLLVRLQTIGRYQTFSFLVTNTFSVEVKILVNGSYILKKYGSNTATFCLFSSFNGKFSSKFYIKSLDGLLEIRTRDRWMVGADESTSHSDAPNVTYCLVICCNPVVYLIKHSTVVIYDCIVVLCVIV